MVVYVLVHGSGHGGWCWARVVPLLRAAGHAVHTPTLTGLGERQHLLSDATDLAAHIADIAGVLRDEDLAQVILVGHSYGGMVITGVADQMPERVGQRIYLDAFVPRSGESACDVAPGLMAVARSQGRTVNGIELVLWPEIAVHYYGLTDPADLIWVKENLTPHPWACFTQKLRLAHAEAIDAIPRTDIHCASMMRFAPDQAERSRGADRVWDLDTGHDAMITAPEALAEMLLRLVR
jgi:pimeloyl-ACP methyl ester carboxylesterase